MKKRFLIISALLLLSSCTFDLTIGGVSSNNTSIESTFIDDTSSIITPSLTTSEVSISSTSKVEENIDQELLIDRDFNSLSSWIIYKDDGKKLDVLNHGNGTLTLNVNNNGATTHWSNQVLQNGIILKANYTYKISFTISSSITRDIQFLIQQDTDYDPIPLNNIISLSANEVKEFNASVTIPSTSTYLYGFMLGNINGTHSYDHTITISNVSLIGYKEKVNSSTGLDGTYDDAPATKYDLDLAWSDEFNGNSLDRSKWSNDIGTGSWGWGNNEQQYYTAREENCSVSNGSLKITALKEQYSGSSYTSAKIISKGKYQTKYGYIEARLALPSMLGIWPAFWMLGANIDSNPWPHCGEIDIMEAINYNSHIYSTLHWNQGTSTSHASSGTGAIDVGDRTEYHTYGFLWTENEMRFYHDDILHYVFDMTTNSSLNCFKKDFYFIFNVAVGGNWPGFDIGNNFPMTMSVDYLRVYQ